MLTGTAAVGHAVPAGPAVPAVPAVPAGPAVLAGHAGPAVLAGHAGPAVPPTARLLGMLCLLGLLWQRADFACVQHLSPLHTCLQSRPSRQLQQLCNQVPAICSTSCYTQLLPMPKDPFPAALLPLPFPVLFAGSGPNVHVTALKQLSLMRAWKCCRTQYALCRHSRQALVTKVLLQPVASASEDASQAKAKLWLTAKNNTVLDIIDCMSQVRLDNQFRM